MVSGRSRPRRPARGAPHLRRPLSMQHRSPQVLSPSSFPTSACPGASMDAERCLNRRRRWVRPPGTRLSGVRPAGRGQAAPTDRALSRRASGEAGSPRLRARGFASFYGSLGTRLALAVKRAASGARRLPGVSCLHGRHGVFAGPQPLPPGCPHLVGQRWVPSSARPARRRGREPVLARSFHCSVWETRAR